MKRLYKRAGYMDILEKFFEQNPDKKHLIDEIYEDIKGLYSLYWFEDVFPITYDEDANANMYEMATNSNAYEELCQYDCDDIADDFFEDCQYNENDLHDIKQAILDYIIEEKYDDFEEHFENNKNEFIKKYSNAVGFNEYGNTYGNTNNTLDNQPIDENVETDHIANSIQALYNLKDAINETTEMHFSIDRPNRDYPIVYINGELYDYSDCTSHTQVINEYCREEGLAEAAEKDKRLNNVSLSLLLPANTSVAYISAYHNIAFIEATQSCDIKDVIKELVDAGFEKVYNVRGIDELVGTRVAKIND